MPRYFIHIEEDDNVCRDREGFWSYNLADALMMVKRAAGEIIADQLEAGYTDTRFSLCLDDEKGKRLMTMPVSTVIGPPIE